MHPRLQHILWRIQAIVLPIGFPILPSLLIALLSLAIGISLIVRLSAHPLPS